MKKDYIIAMAIGMLLATNRSFAQTEVTNGVMHGKDYGVTYMLPKTELEITIETTSHTYVPGEFCKYAKRYLRLNDIDKNENTYWTLDKVTVNLIGTPDKEHIYFVKLKNKSTAPLMELTEDGIVRSINYPFSGLPKKKKTEPVTPVDTVTNIDPHTFLTEEILMANSSAKMAELIAKEIYSLRESKNALIRGEADFMPKDGMQLKIMIDNLTLQEKVLTEMFSGKKNSTRHTHTLRITPEEMKQAVAFRFSKKLGLVDKDDLAGEPVYIDIINRKLIPPSTTDEEQKQEGVVYNVPGRAQIELTYRNKKLFKNELPVTQFGSQEYLAPILFNKNMTTKVLFDVKTGGLLKIERAESK